MPRRLLRNAEVSVDDWRYAADGATAAPADGGARHAGAAGGADASGNADSDDAQPPGGIIVPFERWLAERDVWLARRIRLGVVLLPAHRVETLAPDLAHFALVAARFPGPADGRGYTQGRLLRERHAFTGELRATGYVRLDQVFLLARCGFNAFELPENELAAAAGALSTFSAEYQPSNDAGLPLKLRRR